MAPGAPPERRDPRHGMQDARPPRDREPREGGRDRNGVDGRPQPAVHSARPFNGRGDDNRQAPRSDQRGDQRQAPRGDQRAERPAHADQRQAPRGDQRQAPRADRQAPRADQGAKRYDGPRQGQSRGPSHGRPQGQDGRRSPAGRSR